MSVIVRDDDGKLQSWLSQGQRREEETLRLFQDEGSLLAMQEMRGIVPFRKGFLRESIMRNLTPAGFSVYPTASYAKIVDQGASPHTIFPSAAKVLRFELPSGGVIFARHVQHPGFIGRFFIRRTAEAIRSRLADLLNKITERVYRV